MRCCRRPARPPGSSIDDMHTSGIHHVGVAVTDLDEAVGTYTRVLGGTLEHRDVVPDQGV